MTKLLSRDTLENQALQLLQRKGNIRESELNK